MHVRIQTWFPFQIQIYINGREWLAKQLDGKGIGYQRLVLMKMGKGYRILGASLQMKKKYLPMNMKNVA